MEIATAQLVKSSMYSWSIVLLLLRCVFYIFITLYCVSCRFVLEENSFAMTEENNLLPDLGESVALPIQPVLSSVILKVVSVNFKKETLGAVSVIHIYSSL